MLCAGGANLAHVEGVALAAGLDARGEETAKEATRLYKQGDYEAAAKLYSELSVDYPDMPIFERNVGACFYYLNRPGPALSNLRNYLLHKKDIAPDDKAVVDRWIEEMERLRAQNQRVTKAPPPAAPLAPAPLSVPPPAPASTAAPGLDLSAPSAPSGEAHPFYTRGWFWGTVGAVVVAGAATAVVLSTRKGGSNVPSSTLGNQEAFQ